MRDKVSKLKTIFCIENNAEYPAFCRWSSVKKYYE